MIKYVIKRLFYAIPVFLGITFTVYLLINLAPGGPLSILAASGEMSLSDLEALKASLGLDKPVLVRYFLWLADLLHGNLGTSYRTSQAVSMMIGTLEFTRISRHTCHPSIFGIITSRIINAMPPK